MQKDKNAIMDELFDDSKNTRFGCVMFDLQETPDSNGKFIPMPGSGWASIEGAGAFRIKSIGELSSDVKWLTNLSQDILWKTGAVAQAKLKHSGYLRTDVGQIMKEVGLTPPKTPIADVCEAISEIFTKTMKLAIEFYGIKSFNQKELYSELKATIIGQDNNISSYVDEALIRSYQDLVICEKSISKEKNLFVTLKRPRYFHAKSILDTSIPVWDADWDFFGPDDLPEDNEEKIDFLMNKGRPFVAKISINSFTFEGKINVDLSKLLNLGEAIGEGGKTKDRNWVCQPEMLYLRKFADINIDAAFLATKYETLENKINVPYLGELSDFSYSLGLLSECVWIALASRSVNPQTRSKTLVSPRACWLKAADRFMTLTSAMMLSSAGFLVTSYGYGGVTVMIEESKIGSLIEIAPHAGLSVPVNIIERANIQV